MTASQNVDDFYRRLWNSSRWGGTEPNTDEAARFAVIRRFIQCLPTDSERRVLDLGCGRGWLTSLLADYGQPLGVDPVPSAIEQAQELFPHLSFRCADTRGLLRETLRFDLIVSSEVLEHVPEDAQAAFLDDCRSLLRPGGHLVLTTPRKELWHTWRRRAATTQPVEAWLSEDELSHLATEAKFEILSRDRADGKRTRPLVWQGWLLRRVLERRGVRHLPLGLVRRRLAYSACLYQAVLLRRPPGDER